MKFTKQQAARLLQLGAIAEQVARLEACLLKLKRLNDREKKRPALADVRDKFADAEKRLHALRTALQPKSSAGDAFRHAMESASAHKGGLEPIIEATLARLDELDEVMKLARSTLPKKATRKQSASPELIRIIDVALKGGWVDAGNLPPGLAKFSGTPLAFGYDLHPSRDGNFAEVVALALEAAKVSKANASHEWAIRAYLSLP